MFIKKLRIRNFRGIKSLDWVINSRVIPLVGRGDSCKSTILDALEFLFNGFDRALPTEDLFNVLAGIEEDALIEATILELPDELLNSDRYIDALCGFDKDGLTVGELTNEREPCLVLRVAISRDALPEWTLLDSAGAPRRRMNEHDRRALRYISLVKNSVNHLNWNDRSVLRRSLEDRSDVDLLVLSSVRNAHVGAEHPLKLSVDESVDSISQRISGSGAYSKGPFHSGISPQHRLRGGAWELFDNSGVPLSAYGEGSKRLISFGLQEDIVGVNSVIALDEIETGLEPHRLSRLLQRLQERISNNAGQVFLSTHSPRVIEHFGQLTHVVRRTPSHGLEVTPIPAELRTEKNGIHGTIREHAAALLAETIVLLEGATEVGLVRELFRSWDLSSAEDTGSLGVELVDAKGSSRILPRAKAFRQLGFRVIVLMDNDTEDSASIISQLQEVGVFVCATDSGQSIEQDLFSSYTKKQSIGALHAATLLLGEDVVLNRLSACLGTKIDRVQNIYDSSWDDFDRRLGLAVSGKPSLNHKIPKQDGGLFKTQDGGSILAKFALGAEEVANPGSLPAVLRELKIAIYGEGIVL